MIIRKQEGLSLISLLVGLLLSMLCILAGLTLYRSTLQLSTGAKLGAQIDGQITSALLTVQHELQNAGYGITTSAFPNITRADYVSSGNTVAVLAWRYLNGADYICRAVKEYAHTDGDDISYRQLALVTADNCTADADLTTLTWDNEAKTTLIGRWPLYKELQTHVTANGNLFSFGEPQNAECSPYGALPAEEHLQVTIRAPSSAALHGAGGAAFNGADGAVNHSTTVCLLNTAPNA